MNMFQHNFMRHQNRNNSKFPNKCDICGLRVKYAEKDTDTESTLLTAAKLAEAGLAIYPPRIIGFGGSENITYFCALANVKYWNQKFKKCPDWQLKLSDTKLTLSDYLSIHHSRTNTRIAVRLGLLAAVFTIMSIITS